MVNVREGKVMEFQEKKTLDDIPLGLSMMEQPETCRDRFPAK